MIEIQYMSDLHTEGCQFEVEKTGDVLVLAGDIFSGRGTPVFRQFMERTMGLGFRAVLFVLGNHEGYGWSFSQARDLLRGYEEEYESFHFLDRDIVVIDGVRFLGCPLWSDPSLDAILQARLYINDYSAIRGWTIEDHIIEHHRDVQWLSENIQKQDVVITHFPPTRHGIDQSRFAGDILNSWFANDLSVLIRGWGAGLWISGHTHHEWYDSVGVTTLVGNCRGYVQIGHSAGQIITEVKDFHPTRRIQYKVHNDADQSAEGVAAQSS